MNSVCSLQDHMPGQSRRDEIIIKRSVAFFEQFETDRYHIPKDQIFTLRYEDLRADPLGLIQEIYEKLDLGDFAQVQPELRKLIGPQRTYKSNRYDLDDDTRALVESAFADIFDRYGYLRMDQRKSAPV